MNPCDHLIEIPIASYGATKNELNVEDWLRSPPTETADRPQDCIELKTRSFLKRSETRATEIVNDTVFR